MVVKSSAERTSHNKPRFPDSQRLFVGHQSVGLDLLDGIRRLSPKTRIESFSIPGAPLPGAGLFHAQIGSNGNPRSKIDEFVRLVGKANSPFTIAMMKLCYVDVSSSTNVDELFEYYKQSIEQLARGAPQVRIAHITTPLRSATMGIRSRAKLFMGRTVDVLEDNASRNAYNLLLTSEYSRENCVFDLAGLESTAPGGRSVAVDYRGATIRSMYGGYTYDGGHLNADGKKVIAAEFMKFLAGI